MATFQALPVWAKLAISAIVSAAGVIGVAKVAKASSPDVDLPEQPGGFAAIRTLGTHLEALGAPDGFTEFALIFATSESGGNNRTGLGLPGRFPPDTSPNLKASAKLQRGESRAAERGYDRNVGKGRRYERSPFPRSEWIFGSGGWFGLLPSSALGLEGDDMDLVWTGEVGPADVFDRWKSLVLFADYVKSVRALPAFRNLPASEQNWYAIKRAGPGLAFVSDYRLTKKRSRQANARAEKHARQRGIPVSFLRRRVPAFGPYWSVRATMNAEPFDGAVA